MYTLLEAEREVREAGKNALLDLVKVPRNCRAMLASEIVISMQQVCRAKVIAYYSSQTFPDRDISPYLIRLDSFPWL